jgi:hypothetical protein
VSTQSRSSPTTWPFLVASGRTVPQRVVLAPEFLVESKRAYVLMRATGESPDPDPESASPITLSRQVIDDRTGELTVIFRRVRADPELVGQHGDFLLDSGSRPIYLIEGIILRGGDIQVFESTFKRIHIASVNAFRDFWHADDRSAGPKYSEPLHPDELAAREPALPLKVLPLIDYREPVVTTAHVPPPDRQDEDGIQREPDLSAGRIPPPTENGIQRKPGPVKEPKGRVIIAAITAVVVALLAAFAIYKLAFAKPSPGPSALQTQLINSFCTALTTGNPTSAYALTTPAFDETTSEPRFAAALLGDDGAARSCARSTGSSAGAAAVAITTSRGASTWVLTLVTYDGQLRIAHIEVK